MAPEGSEETPNHHPSHSKQKQLLAALNESTKFLVSGAALLTLVTHPNVAMVWCLIGSVVNSCFGKVLKKLLNEKRPAGAAKKDPGMPSSHAVSLSYLSVSAAVSLLARGGREGGALFRTSGLCHPPWPVHASVVVPGAVCLLVLGLAFTALRVVLGYHTAAQVVVGYLLGFLVACGWLFAGETFVVPLASTNHNVQHVLFAVCFVTSALFAKVAVRWVDELRLWKNAGTKKGEPGVGTRRRAS